MYCCASTSHLPLSPLLQLRMFLDEYAPPAALSALTHYRAHLAAQAGRASAAPGAAPTAAGGGAAAVAAIAASRRASAVPSADDDEDAPVDFWAGIAPVVPFTALQVRCLMIGKETTKFAADSLASSYHLSPVPRRGDELRRARDGREGLAHARSTA